MVKKPFPAYTGEDPHIFVCYAHDDAAIVYREISELHARGINIWYDEGISPGSRWSEDLANALRGCRMLVFYATPHSVASDHCRDEINFALDHKIPVLTVYLKKVELSPGLHLRLNSHQAIFRAELAEAEYQSKVESAVLAHLGASVDPAPRVGPTLQTWSPLRIVLVIGIVFIVAGAAYLATGPFSPSPSSDVTTSAASHPELVSAEPAIAVLPFNNLSPLAENAFFAAGIHEDILLQLSKLPDLIVTSRNSTLMYAENRPPAAQIARQLGVTYLMDGSVRRDGDAVRISVQLIEAASDRQIWAENFDRELNDIFEIQLEVAEAVAEALQVRLLRTADADHRLPNVVAYERFLAARSVAREFTAEAAALSIKRYREALDIDASYGNAWAGMSIVYSDARFTGLAIDDYNNKALEAAQKALQLSPDEWLPNYAMAYYLSSMDVQRFDAARPFFDKALARNPNNAEVLLSQGNALIWAGRGFEAIESYRKSYRRNPKDENAVVGAAVAAAIAGESERAEALIQEFIALAPDNVYLHVWAGSVYNWMNHWESAVDAFAHALELDPGNVGTMIWLGAMFTAVDDHEAAEYWLDRAEPIDPENEDLAFNRSDFLMAAGRTEEAIAQADQWYARHPGGARAKLFKGYGYALKARQAWGREDQQGWHENLQLQLDYLLSFIRDRDVTGENGVQFFSGWATLSAAQAAALLGDQPLSDELHQRVIDYHQEQPPGITMFSANQLGIAHAALGDRDKAIDYFRTAHEEGHHRFFVLANINLDSGIYDMYGNIHNDIAFKEIVAGEAENNAELRARTRARHPQLFPDTM